MGAQTATTDACDYDAGAELDRQLETLLRLGYPALAGLAPGALEAAVDALRGAVLARAGELDPPTRARVPFVLVVAPRLAPPTRTMPLTALGGRAGFVSADTADVDRFAPIPGVEVPGGLVYAALDVDRGRETLNATPDEGVRAIAAAGRSPLTTEEGIALITLHPEALERNNCFQLAGSRCGDRRVPGLWISDRRPKLGFCWAGNRHAWLGLASCRARLGAG